MGFQRERSKSLSATVCSGGSLWRGDCEAQSIMSFGTASFNGSRRIPNVVFPASRAIVFMSCAKASTRIEVKLQQALRCPVRTLTAGTIVVLSKSAPLGCGAHLTIKKQYSGFNG
jgi:hypothetical protein